MKKTPELQYVQNEIEKVLMVYQQTGDRKLREKYIKLCEVEKHLLESENIKRRENGK